MNEKYEMDDFSVLNAIMVLAELMRTRRGASREDQRQMAAAAIVRANAAIYDIAGEYELPAKGTSENRILKPLAEKAGWL